MLSASVPSRGALSKLDSTLQNTYQDYQAYLAQQPASQLPAGTKAQRLVKSAAMAAAAAQFDSRFGSQFSAQLQSSKSALHIVNGDIAVQAFANIGDPGLLQAALSKLSGQKVNATGREVDAMIPIADLPTLASLKSLRFAESSASVVNVGAVTSQGDIADEAASARADYGISGAGVKVGIISDSFNNSGGSTTDTYTQDVATGDLPAGVQILADNVQGTDEGRAIAQVVYDSAPGVSLAFATGESNSPASGQSTMAANIGSLVKAGANVIVDDVTYQTEPMFADGVIAQAAESAIASGVTYISAAGNLGSQSYASAWRSGTSYSAGAIAKDPNALNAPTFYGGVAFNFATNGTTSNMESFTLANGAVFNPSVQWDSPYYSVSGGAGAQNQVDVYILNSAGNKIEGGSSALVTGHDPIQNFSFQNSTGSTQTYNLMMCCSIGAVPGYIKYVDFAGQATNWQYTQGASTIFGHANAAGVISVGAVNYANTPAYNVSTPVLESSSGTGGTPIIFNTAGTRLTSYGYRQTPAVVAPDGVFTTFFGTKVGSNYVFSGTSAAAAEVAGLAALLIQKDPKFTPAQVASAIESNTIAMGSTSPNNADGYGFIQALPVISHSVGNITGTVYSDNNANGVLDTGEPGLANAIVYLDLYNSGFPELNDPITTTSSNGSFAFYNQSLGSTVVRAVTLSGYVQTDGSQTVNVLGATTTSGVYLGMFPTTFTGSSGHYNYTLQVDSQKSTYVDILVSGLEIYSVPLNLVAGGLTFDLEGGNSTLTVNFANGNPIPSGGIDFIPSGTGNLLSIVGKASGDTGVIDGDTTTVNGSTIVADGIQSEIITNGGGTDTYTIATAQPNSQTLSFNGSTGNTTVNVNDPLPFNGTTTFFNAGTINSVQNTLNVNDGTWTFAGNSSSNFPNLTVNDASTIVFATGPKGVGFNNVHLKNLNISSGGIADVTAPDAHSDRTVLMLGNVSVISPGYLDLNANDMIVTNGSLAAISAMLASGYNNGGWNGSGIQSSAAAGNTAHLTALGAISNSISGTLLYGSGTALGKFDGVVPANSAVLVKYTYYGDTDLSGVVDGSDYSRVDSAFNSEATGAPTQLVSGWFNGDFNYDGVVNGSDYTLLDNAFNSQSLGL